MSIKNTSDIREKNFGTRTRIGMVILLTILFIPIFLELKHLVDGISVVRHLNQANKLSERLVSLIGHRAEFRGLVYTFLKSQPRNNALIRQIEKKKRKIDEVEAVFTTQIKNTTFLIEVDVRKGWLVGKKRLNTLYASLRSDPDKVSPEAWLKTANVQLSRDRQLVLLLFQPVTEDEMIELLAVLKQEALVVLDAIGRERALIGSFLASSDAVPASNIEGIKEAHGRIAGAADLLEQATNIKGLPEPVTESLLAFQKQFNQKFEPKWKALFAPSMSPGALPASYDEWWASITNLIDTVQQIAITAGTEIDEITARAEKSAINKLILASLAAILGTILFVVLIQWLLKNLRTQVRHLHRSREIIQSQKENLQRDVKQRTAELQIIVDTAVDAIVVADENGIITEFSRSAESMFGYRAADIIGRSINTLMTTADQGQHDRYLKNYLSTGKDNIIGMARDLKAVRRDGTVFPIRISVGHASIGSNHRFVAFIGDISERKANEAELKKSRREALAAMKARSAFLANMSHEIRTPMNSILGFIDLVIEDPSLTRHAADNLGVARESAQGLMRIIDDILDISKLDQGKFTFKNSCFNLPHVIKETLTALMPAAEKNKTSVEFDYAGDLPHCFIGDPARIKQVLLNLIGNAVKFTDHGKITIDIKRGQPDNKLSIEIRDTGIGIPQNKITDVFKRFRQIDDSASRRHGGTGLGLPISRQIVTAMGGQIDLQSTMGEGTCVRMLLPLPEAECVDTCTIKSRTIEAPVQSSPRTFRILLAEDVEQNARLATLRLEEQRHDVTIVTDGLEAVDAFKANPFDVILMDVHMPEIDGLEATRKIRKLEAGKNSRIPIIALTASILPEDIQLCLDAGMDEILAKPVDFKQLFTAMESRVPKSSGTASSSVEVLIDSPYVTGELKSLEDVVNIGAALSRWGNHSETFLSNLISFSRNHSNTGINIQTALSESDLHHCYELSHQLKGVSGTMGLSKIEEKATWLAQRLRHHLDESSPLEKGPLKTAVDELNSVLDEAVSKINALQTKTQIITKNHKPKADNNETTKMLIEKVSAMLDKGQFDDSLVKMCMEALNSTQFQAQASQLKKSIDDFDYEKALSIVTHIKKSFS